MRESGLGPDDLREQGISLKGDVARKGAALRNLTPHLFNELVLGRLPESHALVLATELGEEPDLQEQLFHDMEKKGRFSVEDLEEVAREMRHTLRAEKQQTLFGEDEARRSFVWEKAALKNNLRKRLAERLRAFSTVSQQRKAAFLEEAGNVIDREANEKIKQRLAVAQFEFDVHSRTLGDYSRQLDRWAAEIAENPRQKQRIFDEAWDFTQQYFGLTEPEKTKQEEGPSLFYAKRHDEDYLPTRGWEGSERDPNGFGGLSREDHLRLARQFAEIQKYQADNDLDDRGDPDDDE